MITIILKLTEADISGLGDLGLAHIFVETSPIGEVIREIGFDINSNPVYKHPGQGRFGKFGLLDNQIITFGGSREEVSLSIFNEAFNSID